MVRASKEEDFETKKACLKAIKEILSTPGCTKQDILRFFLGPVGKNYNV